MGRGVSHCASCDGPLYNGQTVGVVGGGDSALQEALTLANFAERVLIFHKGAQFFRPALLSAKSVGQPKDHRRAIKPLSKKFSATKSSTGVRVRELGSGEISQVDLAGLFVYVGLKPNTGLFARPRRRSATPGHVPTDVLDENSNVTVSTLPAIFAKIPRRQAITSAGDGATAAIAAYRYIKETFR